MRSEKGTGTPAERMPRARISRIRDAALVVALSVATTALAALGGSGTRPLPEAETRLTVAATAVPARPTGARPPEGGNGLDVASRVNLDPATRPSGAGGSSRPLIAIVIDDLGWSPRATARIASWDVPLTLAFLPDTPAVARQVALARAAGNEILVHLPMEPVSPAADPGAGALRVGLSSAAISDRLDRALGRVPGAIGINNHMGSRFTADCAGMTALLDALSLRGLVFVDSRTTPATVAHPLAGRLGVGYAERDVFLDHDPSAAAIRAALERLERRAARRGHAIGIAHPHAATLRALESWFAGASARGFALVPVSRLVGTAPTRRRGADCATRTAGRSPRRDQR